MSLNKVVCWFFGSLLILCLSLAYLLCPLWNNSFWIVKGVIWFIIIVSGMLVLGSFYKINELPVPDQKINQKEEKQ